MLKWLALEVRPLARTVRLQIILCDVEAGAGACLRQVDCAYRVLGSLHLQLLRSITLFFLYLQ